MMAEYTVGWCDSSGIGAAHPAEDSGRQGFLAAEYQ